MFQSETHSMFAYVTHYERSKSQKKVRKEKGRRDDFKLMQKVNEYMTRQKFCDEQIPYTLYVDGERIKMFGTRKKTEFILNSTYIWIFQMN